MQVNTILREYVEPVTLEQKSTQNLNQNMKRYMLKYKNIVKRKRCNNCKLYKKHDIACALQNSTFFWSENDLFIFRCPKFKPINNNIFANA